jgi:hypothetical protein
MSLLELVALVVPPETASTLVRPLLVPAEAFRLLEIIESLPGSGLVGQRGGLAFLVFCFR